MFRGSKDDPLSNNGWHQMTTAITEDDSWDVIVSSPMKRCRGFAEQLAEKLKIPLYIDHDLQEICFGEWEGLTTEQVHERYGDHLNRFWQDPINFIPPGGEPVTDFYQRVTNGINRWQDRLSGKKVLIVCHGGVIRMVLAYALGIPLEKSFTSFAVPYACRSRIRVDQTEFGQFHSLISHQPSRQLL